MSALKKIISVLLHRVVIVSLLLLLQVGLLMGVILRFTNFFVYFYLICVLLSVLEVLYIIERPNDPGYKIAWVFLILFTPLFGGLMYLLMGGNGPSRRTQRKMEGMNRHLARTLDEDKKADKLITYGQDAINQSRYMEEFAHCPLYGNTYTKYFPLGDKVYQPLLEELRKAEKYIFLEFFIITPGKFWNSVLEILEEKVRQGVDVRLIYDDMGCLSSLPTNFDRLMEAKGIRCRAFNRFVPVLSFRLNNRDHRKICVIDGHTAFTGGFNLADEYINEIVRFGHWKDSAILLKGEAAWSMTVMFLTMWEYVSGKDEDYGGYRPTRLPPEAYRGTGWVQPYTDSPLDNEPVGEMVYLNLIAKARRYVYLTTPYLIINDAMNTTLCAAAKAGVDVRIMTPHIPDKKTVFEMTRAHYGPLLEAGVKIYEYTPGFIHAKNCVVDDLYATVGSINLDYRSMFLCFENAVWMCGTPAALDVKADFLATQAQCQEVTLAQIQSYSFLRRLFRAVLRIFAPMM